MSPNRRRSISSLTDVPKNVEYKSSCPKARDVGAVKLAKFDHDDRDALEGRVTYELADLGTLTNESFQRIYEDVADGA